MRIYVASSFSRKDDVRVMHDVLVSAGHEIAVDWTHEDATGLAGDKLHAYLRRGAETDLRGVLTAEAVVVIHDDRGRGMATELGAALALRIPVIVMNARVAQGEMKNVFYYLHDVEHVDTYGDLLETLRRFDRSAA